MSAEQSPSVSGQLYETGTTLNHGDNLGFRVGELSRRERINEALNEVYSASDSVASDADASAQRIERETQQQPEFVPGHRQVRMYGAAVLAMRKPDSVLNENNINIFDTTVDTPPWLKEAADVKDASWKGFHEQSF